MRIIDNASTRGCMNKYVAEICRKEITSSSYAIF